jgi:hypothetical protein
MNNNKSYWIDFKVTNANMLVFIKLVAETRALVMCFHKHKRSKWSIQFPFGDSIDTFKSNGIFTIEDMPIAVLR